MSVNRTRYGMALWPRDAVCTVHPVQVMRVRHAIEEGLTALTPVKGSAGYVAIERFAGTLAGKAGTFVFQHAGTMNRGAQQLSITVVPASGAGQLAGLAGTFRLSTVDGRHLYEFEYSWPR